MDSQNKITKEQISKELRDHAGTYVDRSVPHSWLTQLADAIDELPQPQPVSKSVQDAASGALQEMFEYISSFDRVTEFGQVKHEKRFHEIILSHLAPHCGVNQELRDALMYALNRCPNCKGSARVWSNFNGGKPVIVPCKVCETECNILHKYDAAAEAVQTQPPSCFIR